MFNPKYINSEMQIITNYLIKAFTDIDQIICSKPHEHDRANYYKHEFFKKLFRHMISINVLSKGTLIRFSDNEIVVKDLAAINVIIRSTLEAFLLFHYIYCDSENEEILKYRFNGWWREGLLTRYNYTLEGKAVDEVKEKDKKEIDIIYEEIKINTGFLNLTSKQQTQFLEKGTWKWIGWKEMLGNTNFNSKYKENIYSFLSSYAHSESVGMMQLRSMEMENKTSEFIKTSLNLMVGINSVFLNYYLENNKIEQSMLGEGKDFIETWIAIVTTEVKKSG